MPLSVDRLKYRATLRIRRGFPKSARHLLGLTHTLPDKVGSNSFVPATLAQRGDAMGSFKHYLPAANGAEQVLLEELAREHPRHLAVQSRQVRETAQLFFEADDQSLASYIWYMLARLRRLQRKVEELYQQPATVPVGDRQEVCRGP